MQTQAAFPFSRTPVADTRQEPVSSDRPTGFRDELARREDVAARETEPTAGDEATESVDESERGRIDREAGANERQPEDQHDQPPADDSLGDEVPVSSAAVAELLVSQATPPPVAPETVSSPFLLSDPSGTTGEGATVPAASAVGVPGNGAADAESTSAGGPLSAVASTPTSQVASDTPIADGSNAPVVTETVENGQTPLVAVAPVTDTAAQAGVPAESVAASKVDLEDGIVQPTTPDGADDGVALDTPIETAVEASTAPEARVQPTKTAATDSAATSGADPSAEIPDEGGSELFRARPERGSYGPPRPVQAQAAAAQGQGQTVDPSLHPQGQAADAHANLVEPAHDATAGASAPDLAPATTDTARSATTATTAAQPQPIAANGVGENAAAPPTVASTAETASANEPQAANAREVRAPHTPEEAAAILKQVRMHVARVGARATLHLVPAELGRIAVRIAVRDGRITGVIRAESQETLQTLEKHLPELRASLAQAGLEAESFELELGFQDSSGETAADSRESGAGFGSETHEDTRELPLVLDESTERSLRRDLLSTDAVDTFA